MSIYRLAAIATIIVAAITVWQFIDSPKNEARSVKKVLSKERAAIDLSLELPVYKGKRNWLLAMYEAAVSMPYASSKSDALKKVVASSIRLKDFNMAIIAAKESPYASTKAEMLDEIVNAAILSKESIGYAVVATDNMPYSSSKSSALERIINAYEKFSKQELENKEKLKKSANKANAADAKKPAAD